jgi:fibronectin-binding autotransporter adhesin
VSGNGNGEGWGALRVDTGGVYSGPVNLTGNATIGSENSASGTISGVISDGNHDYSLAKLGANTVVLTGANTYGGGTIVSNGTLQVGTGIISNGTIPPGGVNIAGTNAALTIVVATNTTQVYNGVISGAGSLNLGYLSGGLAVGFGGTLVVNGNNTFTNGVNITGGQFWITNVAALGTVSPGASKQINLSAGTAGHPALHLNGTNGNILLPNSLSFLTSFIGTTDAPGAVINEAGNNEIDGNFNLTSGGGGTTFWVNGGTLLLANNTLTPITSARTLQFGGVGNGTLNGVIQDGTTTNLLAGVSVVGPGTWTFAGNNNYVTNTMVTGGTLLVNGSPTGTGTTIVQTNGTLGGSGTIASTVNVQNGGIVQGGDANYANTLNVTTLNLGLASANITHSKFTVAAGGTVNVFTLNVNGTHIVQILDPSLTVGTYPLFTYPFNPVGGTSGSAGFQLAPLPAGVVANLNDTGTELDLDVTSVPSTIVPTIPPGITNFSLVGGNVVISGTNGQANGIYYLLTTTNLAYPVSQWNTVATNVLGGAGNYTFIGTNAAGGLGQQFFRLSSTNYTPIAPY